MHRTLFLCGVWHVLCYFWRIISNNSISGSIQRIGRAFLEIKKTLLFGILHPREFSVQGIYGGTREVVWQIVEIYRGVGVFLLLLLCKIIKKLILFKIPAVLYLAFFDHFDQRRYTLYKSRGVFDALTCLFLFILLSYNLAVINMETIKFREEYQKKELA